ncbi:MAG: hypothetical protein OXG04_19075 [Acidobacteria bacterium]|nr:hypothetical protein [Acidobacteriota bacterium]
MEIGRVEELTVLTPNEISWIKGALGPRDKMARQMLAQGKGRTTACSHPAENAKCGKPATHYTVEHGTGDLTGYCLEHWRADGDPQNMLKLDNAEERSPRQRAGVQQ